MNTNSSQDMGNRTYQRIFELFTRARSLDEHEQIKLLEETGSKDPFVAEQVRQFLERAQLEAHKTTVGRRIVADAAIAATGPEDGPQLPSQIGRFVILRLLGRGGMGIVYLGYDNELDRTVAIKVLNARLLGHHDSVLRMRREAQAMAKLAHPNVVRVFEVGLSDGQVFAAMEYIEGETLAAWLQHHGPPEDRAAVEGRLARFAEAGAGLVAAHQAGIIHRDFKPDNILLDSEGCAHVADFGLARQGDDAIVATTRHGGSPLTAGITASHTMLGTPGYMAPEQYVNGKIDVRTDIFSFCVSLFEALYGQRPFAYAPLESPGQLADWPAIAELPANTPVEGWIYNILVRGLHPDPDQRWDSMQSLLAALDDNPNRRRRRRRQWASGLVVLSGLALAGGLGVEQIMNERDMQATQAGKHLARVHTVSGERDDALAQAVESARRARDHLRMAVLREVEGDPTTTLLILGEVEAPEKTAGFADAARSNLQHPISRTIRRGNGSAVLSLGFVANDTYVAVQTRDGLLRAFRRDGQGPVATLDLGEGHGLFIRLSGNKIAVPTAGQKLTIWAFDPEAPEPWRLIRSWKTPFDTTFLSADPEHKRLAATGSQEPFAMAWDLDTGNALGTFRCGDSPIDHLDFDPGGHNLLTSNEAGEVCLESVDRPGTPIQASVRGIGIFEPQRPTQPLIVSGSGAWRWSEGMGKATTQVFATTDMFTWTPDPKGRFILGNTPDGQVTGHPLDGAPTLDFGISGRGMGAVEVSRDGTRVAAVDLQEIVLLRSDKPQRRATLSLPSADRQHLVFSDDANWLASASRWGDVHVWDLTTIDDHYHVNGDDAVDEIAVSPEGQNITTLADANASVVWWSATGTEPSNRLSIDEAFIPAVSDDGMLAVVGNSDGNLVLGDRKGQQWPLLGHQNEVWSFDFSADRRLLITGSWDTTARVWNLDTHQQLHTLSGHTVPVRHVAINRQNSMATTVGFDGSMRIWDLESNPPTARELYPASPQGVFKASFSPDGRWLVALTHSSTPELFDLKNGSQTSLPREGVLTNICWDPQSQWFVLAARDGKVRRWDPQRNLEIAEYTHPDAVVLLACAPDGASLTTGAGGVVRYWPLAETGAVNRLDVGPKLASIVYTPKSNNILYGTEEGVLSRWDPHKPARIAPSELLTRIRAATTACLTAHQREWILREPRELAHQRFNACERGFNREK